MNIRELSYLEKLSTDKSSLVSGAERLDWKGSRYDCTKEYKEDAYLFLWGSVDESYEYDYDKKYKVDIYYCEKVYYNNNDY